MQSRSLASQPRHDRRSRASLAIAAGVLSLAASAGCGPSQTRVQNPERQSEAEYDLARDFYYRGDKRGALDHARRAIELQEDNGKALYFTSLVYADFCDGPRGFDGPDCKPAQMEDFARRAVKADEAMRDAKNLLGQVLIARKKYAEAISVLEPLTKDPAYGQSHLAWGNYGWALVQAGRLDEGILALRNSIAEPRFCVGHYRLGIAYERKSNLALADESFTSALSAAPECKNLQDAWFARGRVRIALAHSEDARSDFEQCRELFKESATGLQCTAALAKLPASPSQEPPR